MVLSCEIKVPPIADLDPIYPLPEISLAQKEELLFEALKERHLNRQGYLLYQSYLPFSNDVSDPNYQMSHDAADMPAWHGHWMAALAMKLAVEGPSWELQSLLHRAVEGLRTNFTATGITGLLARSYLEYEGDEPLPWMDTEEDNPTKFWQKGENGFWFRNGVSKDQYRGAIFGLATVISLKNSGAIYLDRATSRLIRRTLADLAHYLIDNGYRIIDVDGEVTEFGRLNDWRFDGFDGLQLLAMLRITTEATKSSTCPSKPLPWTRPTMPWASSAWLPIVGRWLSSSPSTSVTRIIAGMLAPYASKGASPSAPPENR